MRSATERLPVLLSRVPMPAGATAYFPSESGQDRFANEYLIQYVRPIVWADQEGALYLEESDVADFASPTTTATISVTAATTPNTIWYKLTRRFWRWKYVNGATAQTQFRLFEDKTPDAVAVEVKGSNVEGTPGQAAPSKAVLVSGVQGSTLRSFAVAAGVAADTSSGTASLSVVPSRYNGASFDFERNNTEGTLLASSPRTATAQSPEQTNHNARAVTVYLVITGNPGGTETLTLQFYMRSPSGGPRKMAELTTQAQDNATYVLQIGPGAAGPVFDGNRSKAVQLHIPRTWYVAVAPSGSGSWTYSVEYSYTV